MPRKIIRLLCDSQVTSSAIRDARTAERPFWWAGSDLSIQLALSDAGQFLSAGQISVLIVEVKRLDAGPTDPALMRKTYGASDCDGSFAGGAWPGGAKQLVTATFTAAEAALTPGVYRLIVRHEDGGGLKNTYLCSEVTVVEDHSESTSITAPPTPPSEYWTKPEADARYLSGAQRAEAAAAAAEFAASNQIIKGIHPTPLAALAAGVKLGGSYYDSSYTVKAVAFPIGSPDDGVGVALLGDSITAAASDTLANLVASGYAAQARVLLGSKIDFVANGSQFSFAISGYTTQQMIDNLLPQVLTSGARMCILMGGTNDGGITPAQYATNITTICTALRNKGIYAVVVAPPAVPSAFSGNSAGAVSASIVAKWAQLPAVAAATGAIYVPCPAIMQTAPGNGIGIDDYFQPDHLHPNETGAAAIGRALADKLRPLFNYSLDPYAMGGTLQTVNPQLVGTAGQPNSWGFTVGTGATVTKSLVDIGGGYYAWQLVLNTVGATTNSIFYYNDVNVSNLTGKTLDGILRATVLSGAFSRLELTLAAQSPFSQIGRDLFDNTGPTPGTGRYQALDELVLRTPKVSSPRAGVTLNLTMAGAGTIQLSRPMIRSYP